MQQLSNQKRQDYLPYGKQFIDDSDIEKVISVLKSDFLTTGPAVESFEKAVASYVGAKYAVAFSNGTAALHGACFAAGIEPGDEVITTPMTFAASANCVLYCGGNPVFADVDLETGNILPESIESKITPKTKAIIPVHYTGMPVDLDEIHEIAAKYNLLVIEDGAHALGAEYKGKKIGAISDMTMFSFHPVKHITTGEGGMITTNNKELYEKLMQFRTHGITRDPKKLVENHGPWYYEMQDLGFNYRMTDIQAALGENQLDKLNSFLSRRREIVETYLTELAGLEGIELPSLSPSKNSAWHLFVIRIKQDIVGLNRREVFEKLIDLNIGVNVHYIPVHYQPYYIGLGYEKGICSNAETYYEEIITLPLFPAMKDEDVQDVIHAVKQVITNFPK